MLYQCPDPLAGLHGCCAYQPGSGDPCDYEIRVQVDFEKRLIRPLRVSGVCGEPRSEVLLYAQEKCQPDCATPRCSKCRLRKLLQESAGNPKGAVAFHPHGEYIYCLRFDRSEPAKALLMLTPREQSVEVKELGLAAYWFATTFMRAKAENRPAGSKCQDDFREDPSAQVAAAAAKAAAEAAAEAAASGGVVDNQAQSVQPPLLPSAPSLRNLNSSSKYLPNLKIVYQVKKDLMTVTMPDPSQLTREVNLVLANRNCPELNPQVATLYPGVPEASCELMTERDTPYTLMVQLRGKGSPVKLLDLVTERKVLRVQESLLAPKHMNFLMERRVDQRATFVLHITFDERGVEVESQMLGDFYLDVDAENRTLNIGATQGNERKQYRVEKLLGAGCEDLANARRMRVFEGGVDSATLFISEPITIEKMVDYLITVLDPEISDELPTTVLSFKNNSLFVKEVKGSDVKLHVTVQRQFECPPVTNANNLPDGAVEHQSAKAVCRSQPDGVFHCPIREGCTRYRILHGATLAPQPGRQRRGRAVSRSSRSSQAAAAAVAATEEAVAAADASCCHSSGGRSIGSGGVCTSGADTSCGDSGVGRNPSSLSESLGSAQWQQRQQRLQQRVMEVSRFDDTRSHQRQIPQQPHQLHQQRDFNVNLDVDLPSLKARLLPSDGPNEADSSSCGCCCGCYLIVEEDEDGRFRSIPCQLDQTFSIQHWCRYTVKSIGESRVTPLFTFRLTDAEVTDIRACNPNVRLSKNISQK